MRLTIYKILPYWLNYTDDGLADWEAGKVNFLSIKIKPEYKSDFSLLAHELEHVKQTYKTCFLHGLLYACSSKYRLYAECQAFIAGQIKSKTMTLEYVADSLFQYYNLGFTKEYILNYLRGMYEKNLSAKD
jgi:hypothetical protein